MNRLLLILLFFFTTKVNAQITFQKIYIDTFLAAPKVSTITNDGGIIASAPLNVGSPYFIGSIFFLKTDSLGNIELFKTFDSIYNNAVPRSIIQTNDKGFAIAGVTINYDTSSHTGGAFLLKTDDTGKLLWLRCYGTGEENAMSAIQTKDKGFIVAGGNSSGNIYVVKTDSMGTVSWTKSYGDSMSGFYLARFIRETDDGGYVLAGNAPTGIQPYDFMLTKIDSAGNFLWSKGYGGIYSEALSAFVIASDGFILGGYSQSFSPPPHNRRDAYVLKTDNTGNVIWANTYTRPNYGTSISSIIQDKNGDFTASLEVGYTPTVDYDIGIFNFNSGGGIKWSKKIGQSSLHETGEVSGSTNDGGYIISANASNPAPPYIFSYTYLVKTDSLGDAGCYTDTFNFTVTNAPPIVTPISLNVFSMSDSFTSLIPSTTYYSATDSILCYNDGSNAIHDVPAVTNEISVFPNPSTGIISIKSPAKMEAIEIINSLGVKVYNSSIYTTHTTINLSKEAKGIYWYRIQTATKTVSGKLLLE